MKKLTLTVKRTSNLAIASIALLLIVFLVGSVDASKDIGNYEFKDIVSRTYKDSNGSVQTQPLWGRHSPSYISYGAKRYAHTYIQDNMPIQGPHIAALFEYDENNASLGWKEVWRHSTADMHQRGSLVIDNGGDLHLIYPKSGQLPGAGEVVHRIFSDFETQNYTNSEADTSIWNDNNYYFGVSYYSGGDTIRLCSNNWATDRLNCGAFNASTNSWSEPVFITSFSGHRYLYPAMIEDDSGYWLSLEAHPNNQPNASRGINIIARVSKSTNTIIESNAYGHKDQNNKSFVIQGMLPYGSNGYALLVSRIETNEVFLYTRQSTTAALVVNKAPSTISGSAYDLLIDTDNTIHVFGGGRHASTDDQGSSWHEDTYNSGYSSEYVFSGVAQAIRNRTNSPVDTTSGILILQEIVKSASLDRHVIEVDFSVAATSSNDCCSQNSDQQSSNESSNSPASVAASDQNTKSDIVQDAVSTDTEDVNNDNIPDVDQENVQTKNNVNSELFEENDNTAASTTLVLNTEEEQSCGVIENFNFKEMSEIGTRDDGYDYPVGLFDFVVGCSRVGDTAYINFILDQEYDTANWLWRKYDLPTDKYIDMSDFVQYSSIQIEGNSRTLAILNIKDGSNLDDDRIENAYILDPSGPAVAINGSGIALPLLVMIVAVSSVTVFIVAYMHHEFKKSAVDLQ